MFESFLSSYLSDWAVDAIIDSIKTIPFLFIVFLFIELFEHYFADKIKAFLEHSKKEGPVVGAIAASIPQCGFSVVASTLYSEGFITRGTIIAVYLATSDEAIPVLLMYPEYFSVILPLILVKLIVAIPVGYLIDKFFPYSNTVVKRSEDEHIEGCCKHDITKHSKTDFLIHPLKHTFGIFVFILALTLVISYLFETYDFSSLMGFGGKLFAPFIASLMGLIPNCAVSVALVLLFVKGSIGFGTMIAGLMTSAGIGLLVFFKNNKNKKDIFAILSILVVVGFLAGTIIEITAF